MPAYKPYTDRQSFDANPKYDKKSMKYQRRFLALLGVLLPILSVVLGLPAAERNGPEYWYSISATFYATSGWVMAGVLCGFFGFLKTYKGYDLGDRCTTNFSAFMALGILIFPCKCQAAGERTGIFNLPTETSNVIHCIIAALLFGSFAYMIGFRFTKTWDPLFHQTKKKETRNKIYRVCALIITLAMANQVLTSILGIKWFTIINETIMLWAFSFAWAVKADTFKKWRD